MEDKLVLLKNYETMVELLFDQELLLENGIESSVCNEDIVELLPMFSDVNNGLGIMVLDKDLDMALSILDSYQKDLELENN